MSSYITICTSCTPTCRRESQTFKIFFKWQCCYNCTFSHKLIIKIHPNRCITNTTITCYFTSNTILRRMSQPTQFEFRNTPSYSNLICLYCCKSSRICQSITYNPRSLIITLSPFHSKFSLSWS